MAATVPPAVPHPRASAEDGAADWYRTALGWDAVAGPPVQLLTGAVFDVLELPLDAGAALLARGPATGPAAAAGDRMRLLTAAGTADELPSLLEWLDWSGVDLDLASVGAGGRITAPPPPGQAARGEHRWLRPPVAGRRAQLPALSGLGGRADGPDLVRLVAAAAAECHRVRLLRAVRARAGGTGIQPLAFS
ncbi:SCO3374 family protein [Streptomyces sp. NPDC047968]|uniref:SCO3374 family protein n=1 Tax=unclassified Streptomyces TaxID=2593676 RepID=UPI003426DDD2